MNVRTILMGLGFLDGNWEEFREKTNKVNMIEPVVEGVTQLFFQSIILYIIFGPGESGGTDQGKKWEVLHNKLFDCFFQGKPRIFDFSSLLTSSNKPGIPFFYYILLIFTLVSVGVSFGRLLTQGENPVIKSLISLRFLKVLLMLILKFIVQSYFLSMAIKSIMYKFISMVR